MHIAEGILPMRDAALWGIVSAPAVAWSAARVRKLYHDPDPRVRAFFSLGVAFAFAATVFPIPVPIVGVSSHICMTPLLALLLGPRAVIFPSMIILLIQAIFFAHGGLTTLGANVFTLGIVAPFGAWLIGRILVSVRTPATVSVALACTLADLAVYLSDAAILAISFQGTQSFHYWFARIALGFAPGQVPLAILEGALSAYLLTAVSARQPSLVPEWLLHKHQKRKIVYSASVFSIFILLSCIVFMKSARAENYGGLDELVIERNAESAGKLVTPSLIPIEEGDLGLFVWGVGGFVSGVIVGCNWMRLRRDSDLIKEEAHESSA